MSATWRSFLRDENGFVITAELVLISTVLVLGLVAGLSAIKTAVAGELTDVAGAIGSLNQSYYTHGFHGCRSRTYGSSFLNREDSSDKQEADFAEAINTSCVAPAVAVKGACTVPAAPVCANPVPCASPCATPCGQPGCGGCAGAKPSCLISIPRMECPPGPRPFTGTDPFAPGAISPDNMLLQGISVGGVCAPPPVAPCSVEQPCPPAAPCPPATGSLVPCLPAPPAVHAHPSVAPAGLAPISLPRFEPALPQGGVY